jgi:hypothetical protein
VVVVVVLDQKQIATVTLSKCPHTQSVSNCQQLLVPVRKEQCLKEMTQKTPRAVFRVHIHHCWECHQSTIKQDNQF